MYIYLYRYNLYLVREDAGRLVLADLLSQWFNIALAVPVLTVILSFCIFHLQDSVLIRTLTMHKPPPAGVTRPQSLFLQASVAPHVLHAVIFSAILIFASNTQIALRVSSATPITFWAGAWLLLERPKAGHMWVRWSMVWGILSIVLWTTFLPPA